MKKLLSLITLTSMLMCYAHAQGSEQSNLAIGQRYIDFLTLFTSDNSDYMQEFESLFAPNIQKIINSATICHNRNQLLQQMSDIVTNDGVREINLLEVIVDKDSTTNVIRFEITYDDNNTESVISIIKSDENGMIKEINEVFGNKQAYEWHNS